jgi:hypothetical protein
LTYDTGTGQWISKAPIGGTSDPIFQVEGALAVLTDVDGVYICPRSATILAVYIYCRDPGSAGSTIVDVHLNGVTIFTTQANRPELVWNDADQVAKSGVPDITAVVENDVLSIDIDQIGTDAADLTVIVAMNVGGTGVPVIARYSSNAVQNIPDNAVTIIDFEDVVYDTDSAVTTGAAWKFTCPAGKGGYYLVDATVFSDSFLWASGNPAMLFIYKNGASYSQSGYWMAWGAVTCRFYLQASDLVYLASGDFIDIRILQVRGAATALGNAGTLVHIAINRID